jgi:hypothetical protein
MNNYYRFVVRFLCSYFEALKAYLISAKIEDGTVKGTVVYIDGDMQHFLWHIPNLSYIERAIIILDALIDRELIDGDKITITRALMEYLSKSKKWKEQDISNTITFLTDIKISMIDDGEETDFFFLHS